MERILGLDIGKQKIGIAMSDLLGMTAQPKATIRSKNQGKFNKRSSCRTTQRHKRSRRGTGSLDKKFCRKTHGKK